MTAHVAIVGGGISGLAALEHLTRVMPMAQVTLLEASPRLGGLIRTERVGGYLVEVGPDVVLASKPSAMELAQRVGLGDRWIGTSSRARESYVVRGGRLYRIPDGLTGLVPSRLGPFVASPLLSPLAKLRVGMEYFIPARRAGGDESIEQFVTRRLGRQMYHRLVEPLLSGISAGDGATLSMQAMFPGLWAYENDYGGLIRGMLAVRRQRRLPWAEPASRGHGSGPPSSAFLSMSGGLQELVSGVELEVRRRDPSEQRIRIRTNVAATRLVSGSGNDAGRYVLGLAGAETLTVDAVVLALPSHHSAAVVRTLDMELFRQLEAIDYGSMVTVAVAVDMAGVRRPLNATGYVVPRAEGRPVLACTWASSKFDHRAPQGRALFRFFLGGAGRESFVDRPDAELLDVVRRELREVMAIDSAPEMVLITRLSRAMPQYHVGHLERVARIRARCSLSPGLVVAGAAYDGVGIPDCVRSGVGAADAVVTWLQQRDTEGSTDKT